MQFIKNTQLELLEINRIGFSPACFTNSITSLSEIQAANPYTAAAIKSRSVEVFFFNSAEDATVWGCPNEWSKEGEVHKAVCNICPPCKK